NPIKIDTETQQTQAQINFIITQFSDIILDAANKTIGKTNTIQKRKTVPWWNEKCKDAIRKYKKCLNKFKKTRSPSDHIKLKESRAASRYITKKYKTESWQQYTNSIKYNSSSTEIWKKIKAIKGITHQPLPPFLKHNDTLLSSPSAISDAFAQSFAKNSCDTNFDPAFSQYKHSIENAITNELQNNFQHQDNHINTSFNENELLNAIYLGNKHRKCTTLQATCYVIITIEIELQAFDSFIYPKCFELDDILKGALHTNIEH
ncbi:hypothetical protein ACI65C_010718, partial [Semiaphis heraclei]